MVSQSFRDCAAFVREPCDVLDQLHKPQIRGGRSSSHAGIPDGIVEIRVGGSPARARES